MQSSKENNTGPGSARSNKELLTKQSAGPKDPAVQNELLTRLKKIEGQVRGVHKMVQEYRDCGDIITQLSAVKAAVNRVSITVLACHLADQIKNDLQAGKEVEESLNEFMTIFKRFS